MSDIKGKNLEKKEEEEKKLNMRKERNRKGGGDKLKTEGPACFEEKEANQEREERAER